MEDAIRNAQKSKPVVAFSDLAASAAYWTASSADLIIASNDISSEFGSIGVMMSFMDIRPMWEKEGVKFHKIYAPESNYKNLPFEKALEGDYDLIKSEELSPLAKRFQKAVRQNRKGKVDITQKGILNGKMYYARDAVKVGLADEIGNREYAIRRAVELASKH
jgi:protease-4